MNENVTFRMWGERGLIATFFADLHQITQIPDMEKINDFLKTVQFPDPPTKTGEPPQELHSIIEPDFANTGFGHPDAILGVKYTEHRVVIILEAKRTDFKSACNKTRGEKYYNSTLKGQLELDYCLAMALSEFKAGDSKLEEPKWVLSTRYDSDRQGKLRCLRNPNVLKDVVSMFSGEDLDLDDYYYLVITTDEKNPLDVDDTSLLPELFKPELSGITMTFSDCWTEYRKRFGWLNYEKMKDFIEKIQDHLPLGSFFLPTYELNRGNMGRQGEYERETDNVGREHTGQGVSLIHAPQIYPNTFVHFSWLEGRCALRDYSKSETDQPGETRYASSYVEKLIQQEMTVTKRRPIHDVSFWHNLIIETNRKHLPNFEN